MVGGESFELSTSGASTRRSYRLSYPLLDTGVRVELTFLVLQTRAQTAWLPRETRTGLAARYIRVVNRQRLVIRFRSMLPYSVAADRQQLMTSEAHHTGPRMRGSFNGRTLGRGLGNGGSNPPPRTIRDR